MPINYKEYCDNWKTISLFIRKYRSRGRCEFCGAENYKPHPITGSKVVLTVAHLDHDKSNNDFFNLRALCQRCHLRYDLKRHINNRAKNRLDKQKKGGQLFIDL